MERERVEQKSVEVAPVASAAALAIAGVFALLMVASAVRALLFESSSLGTTGPQREFSWLLAACGAVAVFGLLAVLIRRWRRELGVLQSSNADLSRLALVTNRTDNAVFLANPEGVIEWINEGFTRMTG